MREKLNTMHPMWLWAGAATVLALLLAAALLFSSGAHTAVSYDGASATQPASDVQAYIAPTVPPAPPPSVHLPAPEHIHAIYMSACAAGTPSYRESLESLIKNASAPHLNAIVIDVKDFSGGISFPTSNPTLAPFVSGKCGAKDMRSYIAKLHSENIYVIARITTFQDPLYTKAHPDQAVQKKGGGVWTDNHGLAFVDVGAKPFWEYIATLGKESYNLGFDELNFDYVRFPSDGPMSLAVYSWDKGKTKSEALEAFFQHLNGELKPTGAKMSADLFGMTTTNEDDLNIGQVLERALPYFDFIDPMVYPSHYPTGFNNYKDVNAHAYDIVHFSLARAVERAIAPTTTVEAFDEKPITEIGTPSSTTPPQVYEKPVFAASKIRPWLQSFDYPVPYTPAMVKEQIKATNDAGLEDWIFWDAANKYTSLREVLGRTPPATPATTTVE